MNRGGWSWKRQFGVTSAKAANISGDRDSGPPDGDAPELHRGF